MAVTTGPKPHKTTAYHDLMTCPVCEVMITAEIQVEAVFGKASYNGPQDVTLPVESTLLAFNVLHSCEGPPPPPAEGSPTGAESVSS